MSTDRFLAFLPFIFEWEGGYDHDPDDPGGETWFGIDHRSHPHDEIWAICVRRNNADGTRNNDAWAEGKARAAEIYRETYWNKNLCNELPFPIGEVVMNIAVNAGASRAGHWLQEKVGANSDGVIGPVTVAATNAHGNPYDLASTLIARTEDHYVGLAESKPSMRKYLKGWLNRNNALRAFLSL